ncbi:MAG TPA: DinB family protein [Longimicrobiales bacterium]|nr:DinB family protein [Longimicrobiales bacterium]
MDSRIEDMRAERPADGEYAAFYAPYVERVPDGDVVETLVRGGDEMRRLLGGLAETQAEHAYAPGKWTIKQVVGHVADSERVFAYRALRIARGDETPLPGFDEKTYAPAGEFGARSLSDLLDEFSAVRAATVALLRGFPPAAWSRRGTASGQPVTVRGLAWITAGHALHHRAILKERYGVGQ